MTDLPDPLMGQNADTDREAVRKTRGPCSGIIVAAHRRELRYRAQILHDQSVPDITRVDDMVRTTQKRQGFRTKQSVRVRDHADTDIASLRDLAQRRS